MKSTAGYWMAERTKWYNLVLYWQHYFKQIPSVFLTVSEPELHDPPLHKLLDQIVDKGYRHALEGIMPLHARFSPDAHD